jgi:periplasmic protein TonB
VKALLRSDRPTAAMAVSVLTHAAVIGVLLWRIGPPTPSAAKVVPDIAMAMPALEQVAEERPVETVTAAAPPEIRPQETQIVEAEAAKVDEVPSVEPLPELIETKAPDPVVAASPPKPRPQRTAVPPPVPKPVETEREPSPAPPVQEASGAPAAVQTADAARAVSAGPPPDYLGHLRAWIERYKQYPRMAQLRRQEGTALLRFTMTRDGRVLSHHVERSSGHAVLDREVEELIERASPLPAMPADMTQDRLEVVVPIAFGLRR